MVGRAVSDDEQQDLEREWRRVQQNVANRAEYAAVSPLVAPPPSIASRLEEIASRTDVGPSLSGLQWSVGFADLSKGVLSFARVIDAERAGTLVPDMAIGLDALVDLCLPSSRQQLLEGSFDVAQMTFTATSLDPNLRVAGFEIARLAGADGEDSRQVVGFRLHAGPSMVQLAEYNDRWMVRDGYHRLYELLRRGIRQVPCFVVKARTFEETGAGRPGFFGYETLFGRRPPLLTDFLDDELSVRAEMRVTMRVVRIRAEEFAAPIPEDATLS